MLTTDTKDHLLHASCKTKKSRSLAGLVVICTGLLVACGGGGENPPVQTAPATSSVPAGTWVVMGSSTAAGNGATAGKRWSDLLQDSLGNRGVNFANIAKGGTVTYHGLSITAPLVPNRPAPDPAINIDQALSRNPAVLLVAYPTNDTANGYAVSEAVNNILTIRGAALEKKIPVLVLSTQPRNLPAAQLAQLQQIDTQLATAVGACFVNVHGLLAGPDDHIAAAYDAGDGIHPNDAGHRVIADAILKVVNGASCIKTGN
jgi:lysophospholipase L1-like esterase